MLLRSITLKNLLSFQDTTFELRPLNVLIGANGSGKSNLIEAISLLQWAPRNLASGMQRGDGVQGWLRKAEPPPEFAGIECEIEVGRPNASLDYTLHFREWNYALSIELESLARRSGSERSSVFSRSGRGCSGESAVKSREAFSIGPTESMLAHRWGGALLGKLVAPMPYPYASRRFESIASSARRLTLASVEVLPPTR